MTVPVIIIYTTVDLTLKVCFGEKKNDLFGQLEPINENMVMPFKVHVFFAHGYVFLDFYCLT